MDFQPYVITFARHRQSREDGDGWYCACCKAWIKDSKSYAVEITPVVCGGRGNSDNCVIACPSCREWIKLDRENDPHKILKPSEIPYKAYKNHATE